MIYEFPFALVELYNTLTFCSYADYAFGCFLIDGFLCEKTCTIYPTRLKTFLVLKV